MENKRVKVLIEAVIKKALRENKEEVIKLYKDGKSQAEIAELGYDIDYVIKVTNKFGINVGRSDYNDDRIGDDDSSKQYYGRVLYKEQERKPGLSVFNKAFKSAIIERDGKLLKVQKKENAENHLEIYQEKDVEGSFGINIVSGTIKNPSKSSNSRWYNYGDKYYNYEGVLKVANRYGIS